MNEKVTKIVNLLFQDVALSEEVQALRDEVLNNCQDRFADLVRSGLGEEESLAAVAESLKGMDEVLKDYPRKEEGTAEKPAEKATSVEEEPQDLAPSLSHFSPDQILAIDAQLTHGDLEILQSDGDCSLEAEGDIHMRLEKDGTLRLWQDRAAENIFRGINWEDSLGSFEQLGSTLSRLGQNLSHFISKGLNQGSPDSRAILRLPPSVHPVARIRTTSGDITWQDVVPGQDMILRSTSGDIKVQISPDYLLPHVEISTMSGDADLNLSAKTLKVSSVSGDLYWRGDAGSLGMNSTSGDIDAAGLMPDAALNTTSGDLTLELTSDGAAEIRVNSVSGSIDLRLPHTVKTISTALKTVSGELRLRGVEQSEDAEIRLQAQTVSGSVKIYA